MHVTGIVAEYNPFHNGHAYQIRRARELTGADYCVAVMSGDFVQRGAPAIYDKYTRTKMALLSGADLVLEIPSAFAVGSAEDFAACSVALLDSLGVTDSLCFGSECGEIEPLMEIAEILREEPEEYRKALGAGLKSGLTFPQARAQALSAYLAGHNSPVSGGDGDGALDSAKESGTVKDILSLPNNTLGIEYCKAILRSKSSMKPVTIRRVGSGHHDSLLPGGGTEYDFPSASALREILSSADFSRIRPWFTRLSRCVPMPVMSLIHGAVPVISDDFSALLSQRLLSLQLEERPLTDFWDVSDDLAARISRRTLDFASFSERTTALKTRQYTYTRISRALIHILLDITGEEIASRKERGYVSCVRVLGFRKSAEPLLSEIKKNLRPDLSMITKTANAAAVLDAAARNDFKKDLYRSHLYQAVLAAKCGRKTVNEYTAQVVIVPGPEA